MKSIGTTMDTADSKFAAGIVQGSSITTLHHRYGYPLTKIARVYYRLARSAHFAGDPIPGNPADYTKNVRASLEVAAAKLPVGWFRYRTAVWANKSPCVSTVIRAMRAHFAACDYLSGDKPIETAIGLWQCKNYSGEVRWLCDNAVLPPVIPYQADDIPIYGDYELRWDAVDAESLGDGSSAEPRDLADLDGILASLRGSLPPLLPLPEFSEMEHVVLMTALLAETEAELRACSSDVCRIKMKLLAAFIHRAL